MIDEKEWINLPENGRLLGSMIGLAVGDAVGTTLEFEERGIHPPVTDMVGGRFFQFIGRKMDRTSPAFGRGLRSEIESTFFYGRRLIS